MQGSSRLSKYGQQTLKNRNHFNLLQQIDNQKQYQPLINYTTTYLDQNGQEISINQNKNGSHDSPIYNTKEEQNQMYSLPKKQYKGFSSQPQMIKQIQNQSKYSSYDEKPKRKSSKAELYDQFSMSNRSKNHDKKLMDIKKPTRKRKQKWDPNFDIPGSDLYEVQDIIKQITSVMEKNERSKIIAPSKEKEDSGSKNQKFKGFKSGWNAKYNTSSKLDEMLLNYKTVGKDQEEEKIPIVDDFYRQKKKEEDEEEKNEKKFNSFIKKFEERKKPKNGNTRLSILQIRWDQLPIIPALWDSSTYLKLQSFPQQLEYLRIVKKAIQNEVKSYSIFTYDSVGIKKSEKNDKNIGQWKLMSEEEYAKEWESRLENGNALQESQVQSLMQFDIEWYRALIQYEYHSGLEDILEKQYDINKYVKLLKSIKRTFSLKIQTLIQNQIRYLQEYFKSIYSSQSDEIMIGLIRLSSQTNTSAEEIAQIFKNKFVGHTCIIPFKSANKKQKKEQKDDEQNRQEQYQQEWQESENGPFVIISQLIGSSSCIDLKQQEQTMCIKLKKPQMNLMMGVKQNDKQDNMIMLRQGQDNSWQIDMKVAGSENMVQNTMIKVQQQLLFGMLYTVEFDKI